MKTTLIWALILYPFALIYAQAPCPPSTSNSVHIVQKGETLYGISRQHKLSLEQLTQWNNIDENAILLPCTTLRLLPITAKSVAQKGNDVPQSYGNTTGTSAKSRATSRESVSYNTPSSASSNNSVAPNYNYFSQSAYVPFYHITSDGETRQSIGIMYGLSENDVALMNNIPSNSGLAGGQKLVLEHRDQRKMQAYTLEKVDNAPRYASMAQNTPPQNYNNQPQYTDNEPANITSSNEFGSRPSKPVEQLNPKSIKQPQSQMAKLESAKPALQTVKPEAAKSTAAKPVTQTAKPEATKPVAQSAKPEAKKTDNKTPLSNNTSMSNEEMDMVREINLMRQNPAGYVPYIKEYIGYLQKNDNIGAIQTANELIGELEKTPKLSTLQPMQCIYTAAKKHGEDQKSRGTTDHAGSDGSMPWDRVLRECPNLKDGNENLVGGPSDIRRAVILLLVDDGIDTRGHRKTLLNPEWQYVACYKMGMVGSMPNCWVQKFGF